MQSSELLFYWRHCCCSRKEKGEKAKERTKRKMVKRLKNMGIEQAHKLLVQIQGKEIAD